MTESSWWQKKEAVKEVPVSVRNQLKRFLRLSLTRISQEKNLMRMPYELSESIKQYDVTHFIKRWIKITDYSW